MRRLHQFGIATLFFSMMLGCASFTPKVAPVVAPKTMRSGTKIVAQTCASHQDAWWKKMQDPVLDHLIDTALAKNNELQNARANILQTQAQLQEARFAWLPTLQGSGNGFVGGGWNSHFKPEGPLTAISPLTKVNSINFRGYFAGFVPEYSLNILENMYKTNYAAHSLAMQEAAYQATRISIISQISGAYFMLLGQRQQLADQQRYIRDLEAMYHLETSRYQHGASDASTITDLERQIESYTTNLTTLENSIAQVENSIQILLDHNPGPLSQTGHFNRLPVKGLIPAHISSEVLKKRPDILNADATLKRAEANVGVAYSNFFPMISLTNLVGSSSLEMIHLLNLGTALWVLQGAASLPLLNGVSYAQIKEAKAGYLAAYYSYVQTLRAAFADVDNNLTNQKKMYALYRHQHKAFQSAQKSYTLAQARYKAGAKDFRDVISAQLVMDTAKVNETIAKMQQLDSIVEVYQSLAMSPAICTS